MDPTRTLAQMSINKGLIEEVPLRKRETNKEYFFQTYSDLLYSLSFFFFLLLIVSTWFVKKKL